MLSNGRSLVSDGRVYLAASVINRAAGLALIPLYAHVLAPADFGLYAIVQSVIEVAGILVGMGFTGAMNRFFLEHAQDAAMRRRVVSTAWLSVAGIGVVALLLTPPTAWLATRLLLGDTQHALLFGVGFVGLVFASLLELGSSYLVVQKRVWHYLALSAAKAVVLIGANLVCLLVLQWGVLGILAANTAALAVLALVHGALVLREVGRQYSRTLALQLWQFGLPLVPSAVAHGALPLVERYFLNALAGAAAVGLYALASRLAAILQMFIAVPFSQTFSVRRVESLVQGLDQAANNRVLLLFVWLMSCAALLMSAVAVDLLRLIAAPDYAAAALVVPLLGLCQVLTAINFNFELGLHFSRQTRMLPLVSLLALGLTVPANAALAGPWGAMGSAVALLLVNLGRLVVTVRVNALYGTPLIKLDWWRATGLMLLTTAAGLWLVQWSIPSLGGWAAVPKLALALALMVVLVWTPLLDRVSRHELLIALRLRRALPAP
jgi:O-antigen/teichoic acid export membrane protein